MTLAALTYPETHELAAVFEEANGRGQGQTRCIRMAGHLIQLRFATPGIVDCVLPAFAHLLVEEPGAEPELAIDLWDALSGAPAPDVPTFDPDVPLGTFSFFDSPPARGVYQPGMGALSLLDVEAGHAWYFVQDPGDLPYWERAAPIRQILHWWMSSQGHQQVHGGAVGVPDGGVLLVGRSGSGKSTTSLCSLVSDLRYAGDDYVQVSLHPEPRVSSLFSSGKVHPDNLVRVPHVASVLYNGDRLTTEKGVVFVDQQFPDRMIEGFPLRAIVLPKVTGGPTTQVVPASRAAALTALGPSTVVQLHTAGAATLGYLAELVRQVPCFTLELGTDMEQVPAVILQLLRDLGVRVP